MKLTDRIEIIDRKRIIDSRGWFLKIIDGKENHLPDFTGEVYLICASPGEIRANHYHFLAQEWFTLVQGKAIMILEDIDSKERVSIQLEAEKPLTIYVPNRIAHCFINASDEPYLLVAYSDKLYIPSDTESYILQ